jgi:PAS domain S-box-containing protein
MKALTVLILEDHPEDAELIIHYLRKEGFALSSIIVETEKEFVEKLDDSIDIILADFSLDQYDALRALSHLRKTGLDLPFIVITGAISEEVAVECMKQGAADYLLKDRLARLGPSVRQSLEQKRLREDKRRSEASLARSEEQLRLIIENTMDVIYTSMADGTLMYISPQVSRWGLTPEEAMGRNMMEFIHPDDVERVLGEFEMTVTTGKAFPSYFRVISRSGEIFHVEEYGRAIYQEGHVISVTGVIRDITARREAEERLKASLKEKEMLLREIHHRVKNNMQIISSLLRMQARSIKNNEAVQALLVSQNRIRSMSLIHEKLYRSEGFVDIDSSDYIISLIHGLFSSYGIDGDKIKLIAAIDPVELGMDSAISCGLIINELITNSLKHAFPEGRTGCIQISLRKRSNDECELTVSDDGIGISEGMDFKNSDSLGLQLVSTLAEEQMQGRVAVERNHGTKITIGFKFHH